MKIPSIAGMLGQSDFFLTQNYKIKEVGRSDLPEV
jgi:hypothetical protein